MTQGSTNHYGLETLGAGDDLSASGYKFTDADRKQIDRLLYIGAEGHLHNGAAAVVNNPGGAPIAALSITGGTIPAGTRVYYKYTWVDVNGFESAGSPEGHMDTPAPITEPGSAHLAFTSTGGTLLPGVYYYILTAYSPVNTAETKATAPAYLTIPIGHSTNKVRITLPTLPAGADGFNVYVKKPGEVRYNYLTSIDMTVATPPTFFDDTGAIAEDCNRTIPTRNSTNGSNAATISLPGAIPAGATWKLYRTYQTGQYQSSLLHWVVEETFETSGIIVTTYQDVGNATTEGQPPTASQSIGGAPKIDLQDAGEVEGNLPMGLTAFPTEITFFWPGLLQTAIGSMVWVCEAPNMKILGCRATLGVGYSPNGQNVLIDVNLGSGQSPTPMFSTIYTTQANRPYIVPGAQFGPRMTPNVQLLVEGDMLTVDIDQAGEGATPTDQDLTVTIFGVAYGFDADTSFTP